MVAMRYYGNVILHLQQYSHRLNLFFLVCFQLTQFYISYFPVLSSQYFGRDSWRGLTTHPQKAITR